MSGQKENDKDRLLMQAFGFKESLVGYAFCIVKNWQSAEDVVQESFIVISEKWESYKPGTSVFSWARGIVRLECFRAIRALEREKPTEKDQLDAFLEAKLDEVWNESADDFMKKQVGLLRDCVGSLPENSKRLLLDFYLNGNSYQEISENIEKSLSFVKDNLFRMRKKLRKCVDSKKSEDQCEISDSGAEFFDELYYGEVSSERRELILNQLEASRQAGEWLISFLVEQAALTVVLKELEAESRNVESSKTLKVVSGGNPATSFDVISNRKPLVQPHKRYNPVGPGIWQGLAACLIMAIGLFWWGAKIKSGGETRISALTGNVSLLRNGVELEAVAGDNLQLGDIIRTDIDALVSLSIGDTATKIEVAGDSHFQIGIAFGQDTELWNHYHLEYGEILAEVGRQVPGQPMIVSTPGTDTVVLGTRFKLKSIPARVKLEVFEGRVQFTNRKSGESVIAKANDVYQVNRGQSAFVAVSKKRKSVVQTTRDSGGSTFAEGGQFSLSNSGLIRRFHFEKDFNGSVFDSSSMAAHGVVRNMKGNTKTKGRTGTGFDFGHNNGFVDLGQDSAFQFRDAFTIGFAVQIEDETKNNGTLLVRESTSNGFSYKIQGEPKRIVMTVQTASGEQYSVATNESFKRWKIVVFSLSNGVLSCYSGTSTVVYRDSIEIGSGLLAAGDGRLMVGNDSSENTFSGAIDDLIIYDRALSVEEIRYLSLQQHLRLNLDFETVVDEMVYDASPFGFVGELHGNASIADGVSGQGLKLSGAGFLHLKNTASIKDSMSFELWVRGSKDENNGLVEILRKEGAYSLKIDNREEPQLVLSYQGEGGVQGTQMFCPFDLLDNQWHHILVNFDQKENTLQVRIDDTQWDTVCTGFFLNATSGVYLGGSNEANSFSGSIDQVHFFHFAYQLLESRMIASMR